MQGAIPAQSHNSLGLWPNGLTEKWCRFFYIPQEQISESAVRQDLRLFLLIEKTKKSNHLQMSLQRQHFLLSYLKTLSVGSAGVWTRNLLLSRPALSQLS